MAVVPESVKRLEGNKVLLQDGAGERAGFSDQDYESLDVDLRPDQEALLAEAEVVLKVQPPTKAEASMLSPGSTVVSFLYPLSNLEAVGALAERRATAFAMELMPRISRAQSMDALSSQSTIAGYKAVLLAADYLPKLFPMLMTAAGTIPPAKVLVLGAGVAGLEAIATARRLGAVVEGYDVRPAAKEQVESLGARFVDLGLQAPDAQTAGGYAKAQSDEFYSRQQDLLARRAHGSDAVITTALVPGRRAPLLVSEDAVKGMKTGSVIVDLAAEQGGNCACTEPGKTVVKYGVTILGPLNLPSSMAPEASHLYSRNITSFILTMLKEGRLAIDASDELVKGTMVLQEGEAVKEDVKKALSGGKV